MTAAATEAWWRNDPPEDPWADREQTPPGPIAIHTAERGIRLEPGGDFILDAPDTVPALWGTDDDVLWARGEALMLVGGPGVGKTTIAGQLVRGRLGLADDLLGYPVRAGH